MRSLSFCSLAVSSAFQISEGSLLVLRRRTLSSEESSLSLGIGLDGPIIAKDFLFVLILLFRVCSFENLSIMMAYLCQNG